MLPVGFVDSLLQTMIRHRVMMFSTTLICLALNPLIYLFYSKCTPVFDKLVAFTELKERKKMDEKRRKAREEADQKEKELKAQGKYTEEDRKAREETEKKLEKKLERDVRNKLRYIKRDATANTLSTFHALFIVPSALFAICTWPGSAEFSAIDATYPWWENCVAVSVGYFLYDTIICCFNYYGGLLWIVHGILSFFCYLSALYPFLLLTTSRFLLYEAGVPFMYMRWFLINTGNGETKLLKVVEIIFAILFLGIRLVLGTYWMIQIWIVMFNMFFRGYLS
eukprot:TRINITY_DN70_c1_g2_i2.p1 TRINITY_DN70_c1_g2~~TRINITY_DN70_c1_g2_i2.p1  ORF type:complete len:281 (-),score=66.84 TRINITY_DN70_c1_g2_i2:270-1112(-)